MVTTAQLAAIMGGDIDYSQHVAAANEAMRRAQCATVLRQAMFLAQIGHESAGLRHFREIDPGYYLRGRSDLGHGPGEGEQWRGAGPIQLTGKNNFQAFGAWCHVQGLVDDSEVFVRQPELVATPRWGWLSASYYWTVARPDINQLADAGDIIGVTRRINGGTNGLDDRERRYRLALRILRKETPMVEKILPYSRDQVTQDTGYFCGPASCQTVIRAATGTLIDESVLAVELGTTDEGTSSIDRMPPVLNRRIPGALYEYRVMPNDPPTPTQTELLWDDITADPAEVYSRSSGLELRIPLVADEGVWKVGPYTGAGKINVSNFGDATTYLEITWQGGGPITLPSGATLTLPTTSERRHLLLNPTDSCAIIDDTGGVDHTLWRQIPYLPEGVPAGGQRTYQLPAGATATWHVSTLDPWR